jgi:hypothetical protein
VTYHVWERAGIVSVVNAACAADAAKTMADGSAGQRLITVERQGDGLRKRFIVETTLAPVVTAREVPE